MKKEILLNQIAKLRPGYVGVRYQSALEKVGDDYRVSKEHQGEVIKLSSGTFNYGAHFENLKQNAQRDFKAQPKEAPKGRHYYVGPKGPDYHVLQSDNDLGSCYLNLAIVNLGHPVYLKDGKEITVNEMIQQGILIPVNHRDDYIKQARPKNAYITLSFDNIISITQNRK